MNHVDSLLAVMTLEEKVGQLNLVAAGQALTGPNLTCGTTDDVRRRFLVEIEKLFVQVLLLAREMGVLKMGTIVLDGTKIHANASGHSALSYEHAGKIEAQLTAEVADLMARAKTADAADIPDGISIPDELARREERLRKLAEALAKIEARQGTPCTRAGGG